MQSVLLEGLQSLLHFHTSPPSHTQLHPSPSPPSHTQPHPSPSPPSHTQLHPHPPLPPTPNCTLTLPSLPHPTAPSPSPPHPTHRSVPSAAADDPLWRGLPPLGPVLGGEAAARRGLPGGHPLCAGLHLHPGRGGEPACQEVTRVCSTQSCV